MSNMNFSIYNDAKEVRKNWQRHIRNESRLTDVAYRMYMQKMYVNTYMLTPYQPKNINPHHLRDSIRVLNRGYLKCTLMAEAHTYDGVDYGAIRHENEAKKYTTPGTGTRYLAIPFNYWTSWLLNTLQSVYWGQKNPIRIIPYVTIKSGQPFAYGKVFKVVE